jgi:hypothetical protein
MVWAMRDSVGRRLSDFWAMRATAEAAEDADAQRERHRHVGDFSLFWTGVYPESAARVASGTVRVTLGDLQREGQRAYLVASTMARDEEAAVLRRLSAEFSLCAFGLGRVRQEWERREPPNAAGPGVILA